jgi:hypothetical protein
MKLNLTLIAILFVINTGITFGQEEIKEASISLELPNNSWNLINKMDQNGMQIYFYKRNPIIDKNGNSIIPNISIIVEDVNKDLDVVTYSAFKRGQVNFEVIEMFIHEDEKIDFENAVGYKGKYNDQFGEHTVYIVHAINNQKGVQIIFDVLTDLFSELDPEFKKTLKSIKKG